MANKPQLGKGTRAGQEHTHNVFHLVVVHEGVGHMMHDGTLVSIPEHHLVVISPGEPHQFLTNLEKCVYSAITFDYLSVGGHSELVVSFQTLLNLLVGKDTSIDYLIGTPQQESIVVSQRMAELAEACTDEPCRAVGMLQAFLLDCVCWSLPDRTFAGIDNQMDYVYGQVAKYYREPLPVDQLAEQVALSRRTLTRQFKARFGVSLKQLQIRFRMEAASLMLQTTNMRVQEIAEEIGYRDVYQFTAAFKKVQGASPTAYRKCL